MTIPRDRLVFEIFEGKKDPQIDIFNDLTYLSFIFQLYGVYLVSFNLLCNPIFVLSYILFFFRRENSVGNPPILPHVHGW